MSDPVTNVEIEDVLSSIRRLVSEDSRPDSLSDAPSAPPAAAGRLVLTPALRVSGEPAEERDETGDDATDREQARHAAPFAARLVPSEEEIAEVARRSFPVDAQIAKAAEEAHEELLPPQAASEAEAEVEEAPFIEVEEAEASIADFFATKLRSPRPPATAPESVEEPEAQEGSLARKIAELEEMISRSTHEFEPERGEEPPAAIFRHQPAEQERKSEAASEDEDPDLASRPMPEPELVDEPFSFERPSQQEDTESVAELAEAGVADTGVEQPVEEAGEVAAEAPADLVRRPVKILRNPVWQRSQSNLRSDPPVSEEPKAEEPPLAGVDEEHLRALVAEIVREELQGMLGERVSRNVRKLVRRELQRILASDELD